MIINQSTETIESGGLTKSSQFSMKNGPHAFRVLSDSLYTDKPYAIMRELICNARDSQLEAKSDKKTLVTFPTALLPTLSIRDYGTGLSEDDVMNLYTTYFDSTKGNSNEMIGAFGLGSKSPFSYTDEFSVTSWFDGEQKDYLVYIGEDGTPTLSLTNTQKSTEHSGLRVSIQVNQEDFHKFETAMLKLIFLSEYVETKNFSNQDEFSRLVSSLTRSSDIDNVFTVGEAIQFSTFDTPRFYTHRVFEDVSVEMGGVVYPMPSEFKNKLHDLGVVPYGSSVTIYHFPIGTIDVAPSREHLSVNKRTQTQLDKFLGEVVDNLLETFSDGILKGKLLEDTNWVKCYLGMSELIKKNFTKLPEKVQTILAKGSLYTLDRFVPTSFGTNTSSLHPAPSYRSLNRWINMLRDLGVSLFVPPHKAHNEVGRHDPQGSTYSFPKIGNSQIDKTVGILFFTKYVSSTALKKRIECYQAAHSDWLDEHNVTYEIHCQPLQEFQEKHPKVMQLLRKPMKLGKLIVVDLDKYQPKPATSRNSGNLPMLDVYPSYNTDGVCYALTRSRRSAHPSSPYFSNGHIKVVEITPPTSLTKDSPLFKDFLKLTKLACRYQQLWGSVGGGKKNPLTPYTINSFRVVSPIHEGRDILEDNKENMYSIKEAIKLFNKEIKKLEKESDEQAKKMLKEFSSDDKIESVVKEVHHSICGHGFSLLPSSYVGDFFEIPRCLYRPDSQYDSKLLKFCHSDKAKELFFDYLEKNTKYSGPRNAAAYNRFREFLYQLQRSMVGLSETLNKPEKEILKLLKNDIDKALKDVYKK